MMPNKNKVSTVVALRLPNDTYEKIVRRVENGSALTVSEYLRDRIVYDINRKHRRK